MIGVFVWTVIAIITWLNTNAVYGVLRIIDAISFCVAGLFAVYAMWVFARE